VIIALFPTYARDRIACLSGPSTALFRAMERYGAELGPYVTFGGVAGASEGQESCNPDTSSERDATR
jgi:hypothetical protein